MSALRTSRPGRPSPRSLLAVVAMVALLGACTQGRTVPDKYGDTTRQNFIDGCVETTTGDGEGRTFTDEEADAVCECAYEGIVEEIPFSEFEEVNSAQEDDPTELPQEWLDIMEGCVDSEASPA
jgi:hypothetical protein